jgi:cytochrome c oxidase assembly protein subunit 15
MSPSGAAVRRWATAALLATLAMLVVGGILRGLGAGTAETAGMEQVRRVTAIALGLFTLGLATTAIWRHAAQRALLWPALGAVATVALQGYLGARPVPPDARPWMVSAHLLLTLVLVALLLATRAAADAPATAADDPAPAPIDEDRRRVRFLAWATIAATTVQVLLGAHVRAHVDLVALGEPDLARGAWLGALGDLPPVHRHLGGLIGMAAAGLAMLSTRCRPRDPVLGRAAATALVLCIAQSATGLNLTYRALPPDAQALHLPLAVLFFGVIFFVALRAGRAASAPTALDAP